MTDYERRIESELREIKTMLMILVPSYGEMEKKAAEFFGWNDASKNGMISFQQGGTGRVQKGRRNISKTNL